MLFEEGISLQDQLWDLLSAVEGARKPSKDHISNCFKTVPTVELRLVIESVRYTTLERTILGNPKDVATYNEIKSRLRKIPLKKDALRAVQPKPEYAHLLSLPLSSEDRPASSLDSSNHQSEDVAEKNTSMQTSSSSQDEETDEEESQFATQAITQLRNKKRSRKTKRSNDGSFDSFDDLDFDEIASTSAPRNIARKGGQSGRKSNVKRKNRMDTFSDLEFEGVEDMAVVPRKGSLANSDGSSRQRKKIGGPVAKKSGILQRPASSSSSSGSEDSGSDSSWSGKSYVSATEAYIPRDQQKRLDAPECMYIIFPKTLVVCIVDLTPVKLGIHGTIALKLCPDMI